MQQAGIGSHDLFRPMSVIRHNDMTRSPLLGVIGGTGFETFPEFEIENRESMVTPYGEPSCELLYGTLSDTRMVFLSRHGNAHQLLPHQVNYRANLYALMRAGVTELIALGAVGGIAAGCKTGSIVLPHQILDYTWGRESTFHAGPGQTGPGSLSAHVDFTVPYDPAIRSRLQQAALEAGVPVVMGGVYGATQGPRLETSAEIDRMERDGADIVGMTAMPEAVLARELALPYAALCMVVNAAAGRGEDRISLDEIARVLEQTTLQVLGILVRYCRG